MSREKFEEKEKALAHHQEAESDTSVLGQHEGIVQEDTLEMLAPVRFSLNLPFGAAKVVKEVAKKDDISVTEVFRRAIAIMKLMDDEREAGNRIQTVDPSGNATGIYFL